VDLGEGHAITSRRLGVRATVRATFKPLNVTPFALHEHTQLEIERHDDGRPRVAGQGFALVRAGGGRILAPEVLVDPGKSGRPAGYGDPGPMVGEVAMLGEDGRRLSPSAGGPDRADGECLLPKAAALDPTGEWILIACAGLDEVVEMRASPLRGRWSVH